MQANRSEKAFRNQKLRHFENVSISRFREIKLHQAKNSEKSRFEQFSIFRNFVMRRLSFKRFILKC